MRTRLFRTLRLGFRRLGYDIVPLERAAVAFTADFDAHTRSMVDLAAAHTLTSPERIAALVEATRYVCRAGVPGAFVECGVWRGGSAMVMAATLLHAGVDDRDILLYDTFTHMPLPGDEDVTFEGEAAADFYEEAAGAAAFRYLPLAAVRDAVLSTGYPPERVHFVPGMVEETIPARAPDEVALCRLDTDWYASTRHEMEHLWPRISAGGVLIVDDYGHFMGAKKAVDEYLAEHELELLLHRIDFTGRLVVKPPARPSPRR
jgi:O-methyltransferase